MNSEETRLLSYRIGLLDQMEMDEAPIEMRWHQLNLINKSVEEKYREYGSDPRVVQIIARRLGIGGAA